jgi:uncharacterized integral membrane protein
MRLLGHLGALLLEFWSFARHHKAWWILPIIVVLLLIAILIVVGQTSAPFIYSLF